MSCSKCGNVEVVDLVKSDLVKKFGVPFVCEECGAIDLCSVRPIRDVAFVWPQMSVNKTASGIYIPDTARSMTWIGFVMDVGPGYWNKKKDIYVRTQLDKGSFVVYNRDVPWRIDIEDRSGKKHNIIVLGENDCIAKILDINSVIKQ